MSTMNDFRLSLFQNQILVDELVIGQCRMTIELIGTARYCISALCDDGREVAIELWTSKKGIITTHLSHNANWPIHLGADGNLINLESSACALHLEHMDRGHYSLGLENGMGSRLHINFITPGYVKTKVMKHVLAPEAN